METNLKFYQNTFLCFAALFSSGACGIKFSEAISPELSYKVIEYICVASSACCLAGAKYHLNQIKEEKAHLDAISIIGKELLPGKTSLSYQM